jgi:hypothetical protein
MYYVWYDSDGSYCDDTDDDDDDDETNDAT